MEGGECSSRCSEDDNPIRTVSRVYADVLETKPLEYWYYPDRAIEYQDGSHLSVVRYLNFGSFGEMSQAMMDNSEEMYVVKIINTQCPLKIAREITVLRALDGKNNVIKFLSPVQMTPSCKALLFEYVTSVDLSSICLEMTAYEIKYYMFELLKALDYCHSMGIMHRDIKPSNIIIDRCSKRLCLIIGELAQFYCPMRKNSIGTSSLCYRSPELVLGYPYYDYAVDMWAAGCLLAAMVFHKQPFFTELNLAIESFAITSVLGSKELLNYAKKYRIPVSPIMREIIGDNERQPWGNFVTAENAHLVTDDVLSLIELLLEYDHTERITAKEAMNHSYFMNLEPPTKKIKLD